MNLHKTSNNFIKYFEKHDKIYSSLLICFSILFYIIVYYDLNYSNVDCTGKLLLVSIIAIIILNFLNINHNNGITSLIFLILMIIIIYKNYVVNEKNIYYDDNSKDISNVNTLLYDKLTENKLNKGTDRNSKFIIVSSTEIDKYIPKYTNKIFMNVPKNYLIGSKYYLWKTLHEFYGNYASQITPQTYLLPIDYDKYAKEYKEGDKVIFKSNEHKQAGLLISNKLSKLNDIDKKYVVIQKFLNNSFKFNGHKINIRLYLIVQHDKNNTMGYMSDDGIVSYALNKYDGNIDHHTNISSFYDSKDLYDNKFPITVKQFANYIGKFNNIYDKCVHKTKLLFNAYKHKISKSKHDNNKYYEIFGIDYFIDDKLDVYIIEVNIGPGMTAHSTDDFEMRNKVMNNFIDLMLLNKNNFISLQ